MQKSNPQLLDWLESPVVYGNTPIWPLNFARWLATQVGCLRQLAAYARRLKGEGRLTEVEALLVRIGAGEYLAQVFGGIPMNQGEWVRRKTGRTTIEHMNHLGVLQENWVLTHMSVLTDHEVELLYRNGTRLCHNPGATLRGA